MIQRNQLARSADSPFIKYGLPVVVIVVGFSIYWVLMRFQQPPKAADTATVIPVVTVEAAQAFTGNIEIEANGLAMAPREIELAAEVEGRIKTKEEICDVGRVVKKNDTLILIDSENLEIEIRQLKAKLEEAIGSLNELESETKSTKSQVEKLGREVEIRSGELMRYETLNKTRPGTVSQTELDSASLNLVKAENAVATLNNELELLKARRSRLENSVALARAQLERAELDLTRCEIKAPIDGVIIEELIEEERFVSRGTPLVRISDTSTIEVECNLQIDEYQQILENAPSSLPPYALPGNDVYVIYRTGNRKIQWDGTLTRVNGLGVDEMTRTMPCIVEVDSPVKHDVAGINTLVPGMFVKLRIQVASQTPLVEVPARALQGKNTIWVVQDGVLKKTAVEVVSVTHSDESDEDVQDAQRKIVVQQVDGLLEPNSMVVTTPVTFQTVNQKVDARQTMTGTSSAETSEINETRTSKTEDQGGENR